MFFYRNDWVPSAFIEFPYACVRTGVHIWWEWWAKGFNREDLHAWRMVTLQSVGTAVRERLQFLLPVSEDFGTCSVAIWSTNSTPETWTSPSKYFICPTGKTERIAEAILKVFIIANYSIICKFFSLPAPLSIWYCASTEQAGGSCAKDLISTKQMVTVNSYR